MGKNYKIEDKAKLLWGNDLHKNSIITPHCNQLAEIFPKRWNESLKGSLLEIGCGSGADLKIFASMVKLTSITAIDLGSNILNLAEKYSKNQKITIKRGNALSLDFAEKSFDVVYTFGIFHHTSDPILCIKEAKRVLKPGGNIFLYLYSSHEDMFFKRIGIFFENVIMNIFKYIPYRFQHFFCVIFSPICWMFFTVPSLLINFLGFKKFSKKIPFFFGSHPFSLIGDLKDRLMSPVNHRFSKLEMEKILMSLNFTQIDVKKTSSGLYIFAKR